MDAMLAELDGPDRLARLYVPRAARDSFTALLILDRRVSNILRKTSEPIIAQMRFAWWRDRFRDAPDKWPKGEPFFLALQQIASGSTGAMLVQRLNDLVDIWEELAVSEIWESDVMTRFHAKRARVFIDQLVISAVAPTFLDMAEKVAQSWSVLDLASQLPRATTLNAAALQTHITPSQRLPRQLRALVILHRSAILSARDRQGSGRNAMSSSLRLLWSGLTGQ
jgi:15-cis-phytoene synthase